MITGSDQTNELSKEEQLYGAIKLLSYQVDMYETCIKAWRRVCKKLQNELYPNRRKRGTKISKYRS
jgi:hypothetical protein